MCQKKLVNEVGPAVIKDRFFDRIAEINAFIQRLDDAQHVLLIAQRRVGKTSLMWETAERLGDRYYCLLVDVQECRAPGDAILEMLKACRPHAGLLTGMLEVVRFLTARPPDATLALPEDELIIQLRHALAGDWKHAADKLLGVLAAADLRVIVFIDEFPLLVNRMLRRGTKEITPEGRSETELFLSWLRAATIHFKGHIRFVVSGSIGLGPILRMAGLSAAVNTFSPMELGPWDEETAVACLEALAANYDLRFGPAATQTAVQRLGCCIPHHVQMLFSLLWQDASRRSTQMITSADVERVYQERMLGTRGHAELSHMEERLQQVLDEQDLGLVEDLLSEAALGHLDDAAVRFLATASDPDGRTAAGRVSRLLELLEHDGYIRRRGDRYVFVSNLLKDWWQERRRSTYVPVRRRGGRE